MDTFITNLPSITVIVLLLLYELVDSGISVYRDRGRKS